MERYSVIEPENISDSFAISQLAHLLSIYDKIIPLFDKNENDAIRDIGIDLRDNLRNFKRLINILETNLVANVLDGSENAAKIIRIHLVEMQDIFDKYNIE